MTSVAEIEKGLSTQLTLEKQAADTPDAFWRLDLACADCAKAGRCPPSVKVFVDKAAAARPEGVLVVGRCLTCCQTIGFRVGDFSIWRRCYVSVLRFMWHVRRALRLAY